MYVPVSGSAWGRVCVYVCVCVCVRVCVCVCVYYIIMQELFKTYKGNSFFSLIPASFCAYIVWKPSMLKVPAALPIH